MPANYGTRAKTMVQAERQAQGAPNAAPTADKGLSKLVTATSITFGGGRLTAANGTFTAFVVGDALEVYNTGGPRGFYYVTGLDVTNHAYLVVDPPPAAAGPVTASVRTP